MPVAGQAQTYTQITFEVDIDLACDGVKDHGTGGAERKLVTIYQPGNPTNVYWSGLVGEGITLALVKAPPPYEVRLVNPTWIVGYCPCNGQRMAFYIDQDDLDRHKGVRKGEGNRFHHTFTVGTQH